MKKLVLMVVLAFSLIACESQEKRNVEFSSLPQKSQQFVNQHFSDKTILAVLLDKELFDKQYEVVFTDGSKIEFDKKGNWEEVECKLSPGVPLTFVPTNMVSYLKTNFAHTFVESISIEHKRYEVELNNDLELVFDTNGNYLFLDD